ncbi:UNVERIFIED_CONTAM: Beta-glucuronidase [Trichonephila clavipes]
MSNRMDSTPFKMYKGGDCSLKRGKGLDIPLIIKDFNLINWIGANSFRTSHYPYAEEIIDQADAQGIVVIDECPAVGLISFGDVLLKQHKSVLRELVMRDRNHPSVIAWSVANEPSSAKSSADKYFGEVTKFVKFLDPTRPVTAAINADYTKEKAVIERQLTFFCIELMYTDIYKNFLFLEITRVVGNKKGIFTRERQPKASAKLLRCRYHTLTNRSIEGGIAYCPNIGASDFKC